MTLTEYEFPDSRDLILSALQIVSRFLTETEEDTRLVEALNNRENKVGGFKITIDDILLEKVLEMLVFTLVLTHMEGSNLDEIVDKIIGEFDLSNPKCKDCEEKCRRYNEAIARAN